MAGKAGEPRVPATLQKSRLKAEEKILDFDFQLESVQFNEIGRYALLLTAENPLVEGSESGVQLRVNEGEVLRTNTATTDVVEQTNLSEVYTFEKRRFLFILPKGKRRGKMERQQNPLSGDEEGNGGLEEGSNLKCGIVKPRYLRILMLCEV